MLTRRDLLRVLGKSAAAAALAACGPRVRATGPVVTPDVRLALRAAVAQVRERYASATGWLALRERTTVIAGSDARGTARQVQAMVVLRAGDAGQVYERAGDDVSPEAIATLAAELAALGPGGGRTLEAGRVEDFAPTISRDPAKEAATSWLVDLDEVLRRTEEVGSSRIVWRAAHAVVDDERTWFVGDGRDVAQRCVRVRSAVTMVAWSGTRPMVGEVLVGRAAGLEALALRDADVDAATTRVLELLTPGEPPSGSSAVVLAPSVTAAVVEAGIGEVLTSARWIRPDLAARALIGQPVGAATVTIADDPGGHGYAGYAVDDEGAAATRTVLVEGGVLAGVLTDEAGAARLQLPRTGHGRRRRADGAVIARASDLVVSPGSLGTEELLAAAGDGVLIEDADGAVVDPATWRVTVRARRARRIVGGKLTGHAWTDVEVRGDLPGLLTAVTAIGAAVESRAARGDAPASVSAPAIVTVAEVQPRRRG